MPAGRTALLAAVLCTAGGMPMAAATVVDAIVIDDAVNGAGGNGDYAVGQAATVKEARRIAMSNCTAGGNVACRVMLTYTQCGAYAASSARSGTGTGTSKPAATAAALAACGPEGCHLVVADCVDQRLQPP